MTNKTLPGFQLLIEDNQATAVEIPALKDVYVIYTVLPELMKYKDEEGNIYDKYIEPNKPLLIATGGLSDAIQTLELSDIALTRKVRNMLSLMPQGATIALCRLVTRDGEQPNEDDLVSMNEAIDFAFEMTENYPMKEFYVAGISLDKSVALVPNEFSTVLRTEDETVFAANEVKAMIKNILTYNGSDKITASKNADIAVTIERSGESLTEPNGKGIYNKLSVSVNGVQAMITKEDGSLVPYVVTFEIDYTDPDAPVVSRTTAPDGVTASMLIVDQTLSISLIGEVKLVLDEQSVIAFGGNTLSISSLGIAEVGVTSKSEVAFTARKISSTADILGRILSHNAVITATQNNCLTFLSPEPPRNSSAKAIAEYVDRVEALYDKIRERCIINKNGNKQDAGMFLSVPVGVNRIDGIGGIYGFPQSTIATLEGNKITTQKLTSNFAVGDLVEVFSNNKLDIEMVSAKVTGVSLSASGTTEITLDTQIPENVISTKTPKYIMNVNNKDFDGAYLAIQYSNICNQVGVKRSPAGVAFPGECQVMFSESQKNRLNAKKFAVIMQKYGTVQGEVDKSQLMTGITSQFQDYENIATVYELVRGAKEIGMAYKGKRLNEGTDVALIKTEIEGQVFGPAVGTFIYPGYSLELSTKHLQAPNGKREKALFIKFEVKEIETMKLLRMVARLS
ncbi:MAG: hypothetical protein ACRCTZ_00260 [Sarcina sp.]